MRRISLTTSTRGDLKASVYSMTLWAAPYALRPALLRTSVLDSAFSLRSIGRNPRFGHAHTRIHPLRNRAHAHANRTAAQGNPPASTRRDRYGVGRGSLVPDASEGGRPLRTARSAKEGRTARAAGSRGTEMVV